MIKLNLGCGRKPKKGYINVDKVKVEGVDKVHDLNKFPYPFKDNSVDEVYSREALNHLDNFTKVMEEIYRILKPNGKAVIIFCHFSNPDPNLDFTTKFLGHSRTFDCFKPNYEFNYYSKARFELVDLDFSVRGGRILKSIIKKILPFYERWLSTRLLYLYDMTYTLKALK
jgi:SAM-dependent methyltransferase